MKILILISIAVMCFTGGLAISDAYDDRKQRQRDDEKAYERRQQQRRDDKRAYERLRQQQKNDEKVYKRRRQRQRDTERPANHGPHQDR